MSCGGAVVYSRCVATVLLMSVLTLYTSYVMTDPRGSTCTSDIIVRASSLARFRTCVELSNGFLSACCRDYATYAFVRSRGSYLRGRWRLFRNALRSPRVDVQTLMSEMLRHPLH